MDHIADSVLCVSMQPQYMEHPCRDDGIDSHTYVLVIADCMGMQGNSNVPDL